MKEIAILFLVLVVSAFWVSIATKGGTPVPSKSVRPDNPFVSTVYGSPTLRDFYAVIIYAGAVSNSNGAEPITMEESFKEADQMLRLREQYNKEQGQQWAIILWSLLTKTALISNSFTKQELLKSLDAGDYRDTEWDEVIPDSKYTGKLIDLQEGGCSYIIKGQIITPTPVKVVSKFEVD